MELEKFISKIISGIENSINKSNKTSNKEEELTKSEINFDLFVDTRKNIIIVQDAKTIKESKASLNRIKFSVKYSPKQLSLTEILNKVEKEDDKKS